MGRGKLTDVVAIRPSKEVEVFLKAYMKKHHFNTLSATIKELLTKLQRGDYKETPLEQTPTPKQNPRDSHPPTDFNKIPNLFCKTYCPHLQCNRCINEFDPRDEPRFTQDQLDRMFKR